VTLGFFPVKDLPSIGDILVTPDLSVILSSDISLTGGGKAVIIGGLASIGFGPMRLFVADNALTSIGSRMALTDDGILVSTDRVYVSGVKTSENGVHTAALGSLLMIEKIEPPMVQIDTDGKTIEPMQVTYRLLAPPPGLRSATLKLYRDKDAIGQYPVTDLRDGVYMMTIPSGIALEPPSDSVSIQVVQPDGTLTAAVRKEITDPDDPRVQAAQAPMSPPFFESLSPTTLPSGSPSTVIAATGHYLGALASAFIRLPSGDWLEATTTNRTATSVSFAIPSSALATPGFLLIASAPDETYGLAFVVSDPTLPTYGSAQGITLAALDPALLMPGASVLTVTGSGFVDGCRGVIGREGGVSLPVTVQSSERIDIQLPAQYIGKADDLQVAVLTADGASLSQPLPIKSGPFGDTVDFGEFVASGGESISGVYGALTWQNQQDDEEEIEIEGPGLGPDTTVLFSQRQGASVRTQTRHVRPTARPRPPAAPTTPPTSSVTVKVPGPFTYVPSNAIALEPVSPPSPGAGQIALSGPKSFAPQWPVQIPLGGRRKFVAYRRSGSDRVFIFAEPDAYADDFAKNFACRTTPAPIPQPTQRVAAGLSFEQLKPEQVVLRADIPSVTHPFVDGSIPLLQQERSCWDPDITGFYLRGVRKSQDGEKALVRASMLDPATGNTLTGTLSVYVTDGTLGENPAPATSETESAILEAASLGGVPPQFLKAQAFVETDFHQNRFRYEPTTQDFSWFGSDGATQRGKPYYARHLRGGTAAAVGAHKCVVVRGPGTTNPIPPNGTCTSISREIQATPGQWQFPAIEPPEVPIRGYKGLPASTGYRWDAHPVATRSGAAGTMTYVAGWAYRVAGTFAGFTDDPAEFTFDYLTNTFKIETALEKGEWIWLEYDLLTTAPVSAGACSTFDMTKLVTSPRYIFGPGTTDTIAAWLSANIEKQGKYVGFLVTDSDKDLEFPCNDPAKATCRKLLDRRYELATSQFYASGSFGMWQTGSAKWDYAGMPAVLNRAFDLDHRCLYELVQETVPSNVLQRVKDSAKLAVANHAFAAADQLASGQPSPLYNELQWAQYWSMVFSRYNPAAPTYEYSGGTQCDDKGSSAKVPCVVQGMSYTIRLGLRNHSPDVLKPNRSLR